VPRLLVANEDVYIVLLKRTIGQKCLDKNLFIHCIAIVFFLFFNYYFCRIVLPYVVNKDFQSYDWPLELKVMLVCWYKVNIINTMMMMMNILTAHNFIIHKCIEPFGAE